MNRLAHFLAGPGLAALSIGVAIAVCTLRCDSTGPLLSCFVGPSKRVSTSVLDTSPVVHPKVMVIPSCEGTTYMASIERIIDADTLDLDVRLPYVPMSVNIHQRVRLAHVDAPERFTKPGKAATAFVHAWAEANEIVTYQDMGPDKYGRRVAVITGWMSQEVLAEQLILAGHAEPYMPHVTSPSRGSK